MQQITTDRIVIVGAGLGALYAALKLAPLPVVMISPEPLGEGASSAWAQGGVAAAMDADDSPESHAVDTERAGAGTVDRDVASMVTAEARQHILTLTTLGTPFDRTPDGGYVLSREAAHSFARVVRVKGDQAGAEIMAALIEQVRETPSIQVLEGTMAVDLQVDDGRVTGVMITESDESRSAPILLCGSAHLMAGGGSGGLYALTTNPPRIRGQVIGMAARAGARIDDAEFVQFHPTAMDVGEDPAPLATEALRGEGAVLINRHGKRFMREVHPDAELAPATWSPVPSLPRFRREISQCWIRARCLVRRSLPSSRRWQSTARAMALTRWPTRFRWPPPRITTWAVLPRTGRAGPPLAVFGSAARRPRPDYMVPIGWRQMACLRRWSTRSFAPKILPTL